MPQAEQRVALKDEGFVERDWMSDFLASVSRV